MPLATTLLALLVWAAAQVAPPAPQPAPAIAEDLRVRFKVVVTANQDVMARVREYLELVVARNTHLNRFEPGLRRGIPPDLALVLLFEPHARMPNNRRELGSVLLRIDPEGDRAAVEYCLRRCTGLDAETVVYTTRLAAFLRTLDDESAVLARRYR